MKITTILFLASILALASSFAQESREWRSKDGRSLTGVLVSVNEAGITVRRANGSSVEIAKDKLHDDDWDFSQKFASATAKEETKKDREALLKGPLTYGLSKGSEDWPEERKKRIVDAMESALLFLNEHGNFKKHVTANNSPGTPTADANYDGWINWGGSIGRRVALHEISHTLGIGTHPKWRELSKDGRWTGKYAIAQLKEFDGPDAVLYSDRQHFWPYGLNFDNESNPEADLRFIKMVEAFRKDMGID